MKKKRNVPWLALAVLLVPAAFADAEAPTPDEVWLKADDGTEIRGDLHRLAEEERRSAPFVLLFHQAGSNRGEYIEIGRRLNALGFQALAIDQRSGGDRWGQQNETVERRGESTDYLSALADLEAALKWKKAQGYGGKTLVWGSSYSASLVFLLAAEHPEIDAILSFSPGEYLGTRTDEVRKAARRITQPVLILTPKDERSRAAAIFDVIPVKDKLLVIPQQAVHGSSMLVTARNNGAREIWPEVQAFLEQWR